MSTFFCTSERKPRVLSRCTECQPIRRTERTTLPVSYSCLFKLPPHPPPPTLPSHPSPFIPTKEADPSPPPPKGVRLHGSHEQRDERGVANADYWNWGKWGFQKYIWIGSFLESLNRWACRAGTRDFGPALAALVGAVQIFFSSHHTLFHFICRHHLACLAGSRAASPSS